MDWKRMFRTLFWVQAGVNLVGALGPEISFDALWYHLPIARLAAERGWWGVIPGGLLYTSAIPRLVDYVNAVLLWVGEGLKISSPEVLPKLLSWLVGIACAGMIYKIARKYAAEQYAWGAAVLWYSNLVVGWQSIVVYVDLHRTLLTLLAIWWILEGAYAKAGIFWGLSYSAKIMAGIDLAFVSMAMLLAKRKLPPVLIMAGAAGLLAAMWGLFNYRQGYSFLYPFYGQKIYMKTGFGLANMHLLAPIRQFFDPQLRTGPFLLVPLILAAKKIWQKVPRELIIIGLALFAAWWFTPTQPTKGDGRYFLPTLAIMAVVAANIFSHLKGVKKQIAVWTILLAAGLGITYRAAANAKFVPYLLGQESKADFLAQKLNFNYGDWYDVDGWVTKNLADKKYLVVGVHNTYYLPGKLWDHESWATPSICYPYVLVQGRDQSKTTGILIHEVVKTQTRIYETNCF